MAGIGFIGLGVHFALDHKLVVVQVAVVSCNAVVIAHVLAAQTLFAGHEGLVQLLTMAGTDDVGAGIAEQMLHSLGQIANGAGIGFLNEQIAGIGVLKGELHQIDRFVQIHQESGHVGIGNGNGLACLDLIDEQRNNATTAAHHIAITGAADDCAVAALSSHTGISVNDTLHHSLRDAHGIDGIGSLIGGQAHHALDAFCDGSMQHVIGALHVGTDRLHGKELTGRHLLECCRMEDVINPGHGITHRLRVADVADEELDFPGQFRHGRLQLVAHVVLLLLVTGEDADLADVGVHEMLENRGTERTGAASDH